MAELNLSRHQSEVAHTFEEAVAACPAIVSCYSTTGQADYIIKVLARDIEHYERLLHSTIFACRFKVRPETHSKPIVEITMSLHKSN